MSDLSGSQPPEQAQQEADAIVLELRPRNEGVFNSGEHQIFDGQVMVGPNAVDWRLDMPENRQYDGFAFFVAGFSGIHGSSTTPRGALARQGIPTVTYSPARKNSACWWESATNPQGLHAQTLQAINTELRDRSDIMRGTPNAKTLDVDKRLLVTHSMGGLAAARFANMEPGSVDAIFNLAACGYGHPTLGELIVDIPKGALLGVRHELIPSLLGGDIEPSLSNLKDMYNYFRRFQAIYEARSCLQEDSRPLIAKAREMGIFVAYQAYEHDILVRPDLSVADHVDHHEVMGQTGHLGPIRRADRVASRVAVVIENRFAQAA